MTTWNILYRGSLSSCNYDCHYCPFAKTTNTVPELRQDEAELRRFVEWVRAQSTRVGILFTPWGEALVHRYYRCALVELSHLPNVYRISIQTNLSAPIDDLLNCNRSSLALWTTFHPSQIPMERFVRRCHELDAAKIDYSVGVVGLKENIAALKQLRRTLRPEVYLWVNAYKREPGYYLETELAQFEAVDPLFSWNNVEYPSHGKPCSAGATSFSVDGGGNVRRCHFVKDVIGNIYSPTFPECLKPRLCTAKTCGCYIGYIHRTDLPVPQLYGDGLLARIPAGWPSHNQRAFRQEMRQLGL